MTKTVGVAGTTLCTGADPDSHSSVCEEARHFDPLP